MALSRPLIRLRFPHSSLRLLSSTTPEDAAADRRRRKRLLRMEPPISQLLQSPQQRMLPKSPPTNPNSPKFPEPLSSLSAKRLTLHNEILSLIHSNDLDEASLLVRHSIYSNNRPTIFTCNAVLSSLLRSSRHSDLLSLHRFITQASVAPTIVTHNLLLQSYCDLRRLDTALEHYRLLVKQNSPVGPSPTTYRILVKGLIKNSRLEDAVALKDEMIAKRFCAPDPVVYNLLMSAFISAGDPDRVVSLFQELTFELGADRNGDGIVYGNLMKAHFMKRMPVEAMRIYDEIVLKSKVRLEAVSYNFVLEALAVNGKLEEAVGLFDRMMSEHSPPRRLAVNVESFNVMVDAYCAAGRFTDAIEVFRRMAEKRCVADTSSYNNLIRRLGEGRMVGEAEEVFKEMAERGVDADECTYVFLMEACFEVVRLDDASGYFRRMVEVGLKPSSDSYDKVIGELVSVGRLDEAREFFDLMVEKEVRPNLESYETLARAFVEAGMLDNVLKVVKGILLDERFEFSEEMKEIVEGALKREGREEDMGRLYEEVEREKAEALARAEEEKARAEALAMEEEEKRRAAVEAKAAADARASAAAVELISGRKSWLGLKTETTIEGEVKGYNGSLEGASAENGNAIDSINK